MGNKGVYHIDLYEVKIGSRIGKITVQYFTDENFFFCNFMNDKYCHYINTYNSFGFYVDLTGELPKFNVSGKFIDIPTIKFFSGLNSKKDRIFFFYKLDTVVVLSHNFK